jgi:hypothetical protein
MNGQLRAHPTNPRYFTDDSGDVIYLTGSHMWNNLVDMARDDPPQPFDFNGYLDFLQRYGHNFIRLWAWDSVTWNTQANGSVLGKDFIHNVAPQPWARTGPGNALDGKPKFDLTKFNPDYFQRLRERVASAGERRIYVSVMLFEGWGLYHANRRSQASVGWAWRSHPFHPDNNINSIGADLAGEDNRPKVHSLTNPEATAIQEAYIKKVVDTVNHLDNVLYEVINEGGDKDWDWWVVNTIHNYEQTKPTQHPVGITGHGAERLPSMLASPADWVSPGRADGYAEDPPAWNGEKVSLLDTDHVWGVGGNHAWVWKSFVHGHNPLFMDPYDGEVLGKHFDPKFELLRLNLGYTMRYAKKMNLAEMIPHNDLASTQYCLANPGKEYLIYLPDGGEVAVDLSATSGTFAVEWFNPETGEAISSEAISGGEIKKLVTPFDSDAVLYILKLK